MDKAEFTDEVLRRTSLVALIGATIELTPAAGQLRGACNCHAKSVASLYVRDDPKIFHCFACGAGGGPLDWVRRRDGVNEDAALLTLARAAGLPSADIP